MSEADDSFSVDHDETVLDPGEPRLKPSLPTHVATFVGEVDDRIDVGTPLGAGDRVERVERLRRGPGLPMLPPGRRCLVEGLGARLPPQPEVALGVQAELDDLCQSEVQRRVRSGAIAAAELEIEGLSGVTADGLNEIVEAPAGLERRK